MFPRDAKIIELGGGKSPLYHPNVDLYWAPQVDIVADLNYPLPISSEIYDGIYCQYALEHLSWRKVKGFIKECHRILKPGGKSIFITANLLEQAKKLVETESWNDELICMLFGDQNYPHFWDANSHHCGFSPDYAKKLFREAGFYSVEVEPLPGCSTDMVVTAIKSKAKICQ